MFKDKDGKQPICICLVKAGENKKLKKRIKT